MNLGCGCRVKLSKYSLCGQLPHGFLYKRRQFGISAGSGGPCASLGHFSGVSFCTKQERKQRAELLEGLRSEKRRLQQVHEAEVKAARAELEGRLAALQGRHREKVSATRARRLLGPGWAPDTSLRLSPPAQGDKWQPHLPRFGSASEE